jgi:phosphoglycerate kinase
MTIVKMTELDLAGKRVLIREDLNVPIKDGKVTSDARIRAALPTIKAAVAAGAKVMVMSHLGRPTEGQYADEFSLQPVVNYLQENTDLKVRLVQDYLTGVEAQTDEVLILENVRFNVGESADDEILAKKYAALCDIYVMDAFGTAHRAQASTHGVGVFAPVACGGPLLVGELDALGKALHNPKRPLVAIVGGSKVSTKLTVLDALSKIADQLVVGGGISNTFVAARGYNVGRSLHEADLIPEAKRLMDLLDIPETVDVRVGKNYNESEPAVIKDVSEVQDD